MSNPEIAVIGVGLHLFRPLGLMKQKWPEQLVIVDEVSLTGLGRVSKTELARQLSGRDT
jgi:non-ribosomal peptide synthetase component E (peptide arylation enzyme)